MSTEIIMKSLKETPNVKVSVEILRFLHHPYPGYGRAGRLPWSAWAAGGSFPVGVAQRVTRTARRL